MAQKLNKKLIFVVSALGLSLAGLVVVALLYRLDTDRFIRMGDKLTAESDFQKAADAYGRAVSKKPNNIAYLEQYSAALLKVVPETQNEATERYTQYLGTLQMLARADRDNISRWRTYLENITEQCEALSSAAGWKSLADRAEDMLATVRPDGAEAQLAKAFRGYAGARRMDSLDEQQRLKVIEDLKAAATCKDLNPIELDRVYGSLALLAVDDLASAKGAGRADRLEAALAAADAALAEATRLSPDGINTATAILERAVVDANGNSNDPALKQRSDELAAAAMKLDQPMAVFAAMNVLANRGPSGFNNAVLLGRSYLATHPEQMLHRRMLAALLRFTERDAALAEIESILAGQRPTVGLLAASFEGNQISAALTRFDILYDIVEQSAPESRPAAVEKLVAARADVERALASASDNSSLLRADGKIAAAKGDFANAAIKFNEVFKRGSEVDLELYLLAAFANLQLGEAGRALDLVSGGLQLAPGTVQLLKMRAQLEVRAGRMTDAAATVRELRERAPDDAEAAELERRMTLVMSADPAVQNVENANAIDALTKVQAAIDENDFDGARRMVAAMRAATTDPDIRLERYAIAVEVQAGDTERAKQLVQEAIVKYPRDAALQRFNALFATTDPVERIVILTEGTVEDPATRTIVTYLRLLQSGAAVREAAVRERRLGQASAAATEEAANKLEAGIKVWRAKAEAEDRASPILIEADFRDAIEKSDFTAAAEVIRIARESNRDPSQVVLLESQLLSTQGKFREAASVLEQAIQSGIDSSVVFRALGSVLEQSGSMEAALRQYEEAYKRRPSDMQTVRQLVGAMIRSGNTQRSLEVLREARQLAGLDEEISEIWMSLEAQFGDRRMAQRLRENQYRIAPMDLKNALALANFYSVTAPDREDVLNEKGQLAYSNEQWQALDPLPRLGALEKTRTSWRKLAEEIYQSSLKREPENLDIASSYANMLRVLGRREDASKVLSAAVKAAGTDAGWRGYAMLGNLYTMMGMKEDAQGAFAEAIKREDPKERDATKSIVDILFDGEQYELALSYFTPLMEGSTDKGLLLRLAECQLRSGRTDEARKSFTAASSGATRDMGMEMLDGAIFVALGDDLRKTGRVDDAVVAYESALAPYSRAKVLAPYAPQPFIQDAMLKRKLFEVSGSTARGQEALAAADRAVTLGASLLPASAIRAEVLVSLGDPAGAIAELDRYLRIAPTSIDARRRITEIFALTGNLPRAEDSVRSAISLMPGDPAWQILLGDILVRQGKYADAAIAYQRADVLQPDQTLFFREMNARLRAKDYRGVVESARRRADLVRSNGTARTYVGIALIGGNERSEGLKTLGETYTDALKAFDAGDSAPLMQWYEAVELLYQPKDLADAEGFLAQLGKGELDPIGRSFLATLAMSSPSGGPAKAVELLAPIESRDMTKWPLIGAMLLDKLGSFLYMAGDCQKAVAAFQKALTLAPNADGILNNYAYLCGDCLKDAKRGLPSARLAVQINPGQPEYLDTLGSLLLLDKQNEEALSVLKRAAKLANSATVQLHLAQVHQAMGRTADARDAVEQALKMNPDPITKRSAEQLLSELK